VVIVRLFNTVGPRQTGRYGMVLPNFVRQALEGSPITVFGSGQQSRCFCDVRDAVESILRLIATDKAVGEVVNVGSDQEISVEGLAQVVKQRTNSESPITFTPYEQAYEPGFEDMQRRVPALEKLQRLTGFRPGISLHEIVDRVVDYHQRRREEDFTGAGQRAGNTAAEAQAAGSIAP
jgi:UDP-glucose 4-epimerase